MRRKARSNSAAVRYIKVMNDSILKIENLIFEYAQYEDGEPARAVDDVSLEIERGSFTAIIGRNGSGKSTLAKNINGLLMPTSG